MPYSKLFKKNRRINNNSIKIQNWRNDAIQRYSNRGYDTFKVVDFIDEVLLPTMNRFTQSGNLDISDVEVNKLYKLDIMKLEKELSKQFPYMRTH